MTGFKEYFEKEKRKNTLNFFGKLFNSFFTSIFSKKVWAFIAFWIFLVAAMYSLYITLTFKNKYPVECGTIQSFEVHYVDDNDTSTYHIFVKTPNGLEDFSVSKPIFLKYEKQFKTNNNIQYCESYIEKTFLFYCFLTAILAIISIVFLFYD